MKRTELHPPPRAGAVRPEIAIVGAGPVGGTLALLLHAAGRSVALAGSRAAAAGSTAARPIALSYASRIILERAGAWQALGVTPIETIHVSQSGGFGSTRMTAADARVPALGYVIDYANLAQALAARVESAGIRIEAECDRAAKLVVHAEGSGEYTIEKRYEQTAVVALVGAEPRAGSTAYERFTAEGPLALLPLGGAYGVVWAASTVRASALLAMPDAQFVEALQNAFGHRAGRFSSVIGRSGAPLALRVRGVRAGIREAYAGNSAQTLHPVAGQGLNLGLRDAWDLAGSIGVAADPGAATVLERYARRRTLDAFVTIRVTDLLAGLFIGSGPAARAARGAALCALDACAPVRRFFTRRMIYGPSALP